MRGLEARDLEILRTLMRLRYLTTRQINGAFFSCPRAGRRRLQKLSERDVIKPHTKGLPQYWPMSAWRLTPRGVEAVADAYRDEHIPDGLVERLAEGSLYNLEHRDALTQIYLDLVVPDRAKLVEGASLADHRAWVRELRERAGQISWEPDGDIVLKSHQWWRSVDLVPDATIVSHRKKKRFFIELDRSTKSLARIRQTYERYDRAINALNDPYPDEGAAVLVFAVRSTSRAKTVGEVARRYGERVTSIVLLADKAPEWLAPRVFDLEMPAEKAEEKSATPAPEGPKPPPAPQPRIDPALRQIVVDAYHRTLDLLRDKDLDVSKVASNNPAKIEAIKKALHALHDELATSEEAAAHG